MTRRTILIGLVVLAFAAIGAGIYVMLKPAPAGESKTVGDSTLTALHPDDRMLGDPRARIVMVEYAAPQCPVCARFDANEFPRFKAEYIDTGKVYYVFRVFPIGPADVPAEGLARCLPKEAYFPFIEQLFRNQANWDPEYGIADVGSALLAQARIAGMSGEQAQRCIADKANEDRVAANVADAIKRYAVSGTPTFVVDNQVVYVGEYPYDQLKTMLDAKLAKKP